MDSEPTRRGRPRIYDRRMTWTESHRHRKYGISPSQWEGMVAAVDGKCEICQRANQKLVYDHDHSSDTFRGILCSNCNSAIGLFEDQPSWMERAANYVRGHI